MRSYRSVAAAVALMALLLGAGWSWATDPQTIVLDGINDFLPVNLMDADGGDTEPGTDPIDLGDRRSATRNDRHPLAVTTVSSQLSADHLAVIPEVSPAGGKVPSEDFAASQRVGESSVRGLLPGDDDQPGSVLVQAMHDPRTARSADHGQLTGAVEQRVDQCAP